MVAYVHPQKGKKNNKNQTFSTFDALSVLFSLVVVVSISITLFYRTMDRRKIDLAKMSMENLAQDLSQQSVIYTQESTGRIPASAQSVGKDPWGNDYLYRVVKNSYGQPIYLVVLSLGPDASLDTALKSETDLEASQIENIKFLNDDIGYVRSFR